MQLGGFSVDEMFQPSLCKFVCEFVWKHVAFTICLCILFLMVLPSHGIRFTSPRGLGVVGIIMAILCSNSPFCEFVTQHPCCVNIDHSFRLHDSFLHDIPSKLVNQHGACLSIDNRSSPQVTDRWCEFYRFGEAINPGPDTLLISNCNPTTVAFKEDLFFDLDFSICGVSETAATAKVQNLMKSKLGQKHINSKWSAPVQPFSFSSSNMRGLAGGSAIFSSLPLRNTCEAVPDDILNSTRYCEAHVQFQPHRFLFCANLYGPTDGFKYGDPVQTLNRLFNHAAQRAIRFVGPAVIMGDFNRPLGQIEAWHSLQAEGWVDAAEMSSDILGHPLDLTSFDAARHSFILINRDLARSLIKCRTSHDNLFSGHPVLSASFSIDVLLTPVKCWMLPKSFDRFLCDNERAETVAQQLSLQKKESFEKAFLKNDVDKLASCWTSIAEGTLAESCVTVDGHISRARDGHLGRANLQPFKMNQNFVPHSKKARAGDYQPLMDQCSIELRRGSKQLHRLQSLARQVRSLENRFSLRAFAQAEHLWQTIINAHGYRGGFRNWVFQTFQLLLPFSLPPRHVICELKDFFESWHSHNEKQTWLQKSKIKAMNIVLDLPKGGKLAFRETKSQSLPPVNQLHDLVKIGIMKVPWPKDGRKVLHGGPFDSLDPNLPVVFQGQKTMIDSMTTSKVVLQDPVRLKDASNRSMFLAQERIFVEPPMIHDTLMSEWNKYFLRDDPSTIDNPDDAALELVDRVPTNELAQFPAITGTMIKEAIASTKLNSGRGSDGFSTLDLKKLPLCLLDFLAFIFTTIESWGKWPVQWTLAKTICLPKVVGQCGAFDVRPVTVMSRMYRLWGKIRGRQASRFLAQHIPPTIGGPCKYVAADMIALLTAHRVEKAQHAGDLLSGVVIDIVKCYNTVPRGVLLHLLARLGIPSELLNAFKAMMLQMKRFFEVAGGCSSLSHTTTGIIEGCGFAIPAMLSLGILAFHTTINIDCPECECAFFADNWSLFANSTDSLLSGFRTLEKVVLALTMQISPGKSWLWATTQQARQSLRGIMIDDVAIPVVLEAKDLGTQQLYSKKKSHKVLQQRLIKAKSKLGIIKAAKVPRGCKKRLALGAGFACVSYGTAIRGVPQKEVHSLRVLLAKAIQRSGSGANSFLACNALDFNLDPELKFTFQRFQLWKRFLQTFPAEQSYIYSAMFEISANPRCKKNNGPLSAFVASILRLSGTVVNDQGFLDFGFGIFHWMHVSPKCLHAALHRAWVQVFSSGSIDRKFFDIKNFDAHGNARAYAKLGFQERSLVDALITGRNCTNDVLSKYIPGIQANCTLCGETDSRIHRLFECKALHRFRSKKPALKRAARWPVACKHFGLCPPVEHIRSRDLTITNVVPFTVPLLNDKRFFVFSDGTAFFGDVRELVLSASAFVECDETLCMVKSYDQQMVPGFEQSSFIAEMFALLLVLNKFYTVTIYCDCQTVCDLMQAALERNGCGTGPWMFSEIWRCINSHIQQRPPDAIKIHKVKAHCSGATAMTKHQEWLVWGNNKVDQLAKETIQVLHRSLYLKLLKQYQTVQTNRQDVYEVYQFWAMACLKCIKEEAILTKQKRQDITFSPEIPALVFSCSVSYMSHSFSHSQFLAFPWGPIFLWRICWWFNQLGWPSPQCNQGRDVSLVELYVDFMLATGTRSPRNIFTAQESRTKGYSNYILDDLSGRADVEPSTLAKQTEVWVRALTWLQKHVQGGFFPTVFVDRSKSLAAIGCSLWYRGLALRPTLSNGTEASKTLNSYFIGPSGTFRSLSRHLDLKLPILNLRHPQNLEVSLPNRLRFLCKAPSLFTEGDVAAS